MPMRKRGNLSSHSRISKRFIMLRVSISQMTKKKKRRRNLKLRLNWKQLLPNRRGFNWRQRLRLRLRLKDFVSLLRRRMKGRDRRRKG